MDLCLLAAGDTSSTLAFIANICKVAVGLGFVIFVHELGHFLVAKACGVKCEKFYVGFDIPLKLGPIQFPSKLARFQWGETEYGIGILPLGGYVKMLGQDDDPRMAQQEAERIRIRKEGVESADEPDTSADQAAEDSAVNADKYELDPRSFPAKPVPHRMAIISAGVIMNLIFAVLFATYAFRAGVPITPTEVGGTIPGSPAWEAGLTPGSRIIQIGPGRKSEKLRFDWDLSNGGVGLAQDQEELPLLVREKNGEERQYRIRPKMTQKSKGRIPMIGIATAKTLTIGDTYPHSAAELASPAFEDDDLVVAIAGQRVADAYEFDEFLAAHPGGELIVTVSRQGEDSEPKEMEIVVPPNPIKRLGLIMEHGPVTGVRPGSPAQRAGFQKGDVLAAINGQPVPDPMSLPSELRSLYGQEIVVQVSRNGQPVELHVVPEQPVAMDWTLGTGFPMAAESIGLAYQVTRTVRDVVPNGAAANAGIQAGDTMVGVSFHSDDPDDPAKEIFEGGNEFTLSDDGFDWMFVFSRLQWLGPKAVVTLNYERGQEQRTVELHPEPTNEFNPERGIAFQIKQEIYEAESWAEALSLGYRQTKEDAVRVATFLKKLVTGGLSPMNLGGPLSIAVVAGSEASQGLPRLLMFLTFLSANLAVLNFLPIPALDGGHMLFLIAEGVRGKPVDERTQIALTLAGVACLLGLMIFVFGLDIHRLFL